MNKVIKFIVCIVVIAIIVLMVYNSVYNRPAFFEVNAINCISALVVVGISFFIVQRQTDYRKQKDIFINLLQSLKNVIDDERSYNFSNVEKSEMLMRTRDISSKIATIKKYERRFKIKAGEIDFLDEKLKEYQSVIDNHATDMTLLRKLHNELQRPLLLISQRIIEIMLDLYK